MIVVGSCVGLAHQVVVHEIGVAAGHRVLIDGLRGVVDLGALVRYGIGYAHRLPLWVLSRIRFTGSALILLLGCASRRARQTIPQIVLLLLLIHIVDVLRGVHRMHLRIADQLVQARRPLVVLGLVYVVVGQGGGVVLLDTHGHAVRVVLVQVERFLL